MSDQILAKKHYFNKKKSKLWVHSMLKKSKWDHLETSHQPLRDISRLALPLFSFKKQQVDAPEWVYLHQSSRIVQKKAVKGSQDWESKIFLNQDEYRFYSYYQRIRAQLEQVWHPLLRSMLQRYYGRGLRLYNMGDYKTQVVLVLDPQGEILRVQLKVSSGTEDLDQVALEAFYRAGPFPNPPHDLINAIHEVHIPWNFILKIAS